MVKIIGAALILLGTCAWGFNRVRRFSDHVAVLDDVISSLEMMKNEICIGFVPMKSVMQNLAGSTSGALSLLYGQIAEKMDGLRKESFELIWCSCIENARYLKLAPDEYSALSALGSVLGKYDRRAQRSFIERANSTFSSYRERAAHDKEVNTRVHAYLGIAAGVFSIVVLA